MDIGVFVTQMFNKIQSFSKTHGMIMGEEGFKRVIFKGWKLREFIGTLVTNYLLKINLGKKFKFVMNLDNPRLSGLGFFILTKLLSECRITKNDC
ncbi:hypothetical protein Hanom_Chr05g00452611 [Helianthus anomalus]